MSNFIQFSLIILISTLMISCGNSETESTEDMETTSVESESEKRVAQIDEPGTVPEMLSIMLDNLEKRLSLSANQRAEIKNIYQNAYLEMGGNTDDKIDRGKAQNIRQEIVVNSQNEVMNLLDGDQQRFYQRFLDSQ